MKNFLLLFFLILCHTVSAQLDTEHWFAPMAQKTNNSNNLVNLYLSTNEVTPFAVTIKRHNKTVGTVNISKGNPMRVPIEISDVLTHSGDSIMTPIQKGLHVSGKKNFFANLRFSTTNHAEIITSKGRAGLGTAFLAVYAPFSQNTTPLNYTISFLATEDLTEVKYRDKLISLNRGEAYIIEGFPNDNSAIGEEITSNKPITVTNGNFTGQYASRDERSGTDILMDQAVPIERLGKEYVLMKGNGTLQDNMESAIIVATEDDTHLFFNSSTTPDKILNKGDYYLMPEEYYQYKAPNVFSTFLKANKNVYIYQLLSGSGELAAGGFNYIPPLNCYLPKIIDEIGFINENPGYSNISGLQFFTETHFTKLNIITQSGATVKVNGSIINGSNGPYSVDGTTEWETFCVFDVKGTTTIESDKAVTAGIAAGDDFVGYGGYFAGASSLPVITKSGDCLPGIVLEVDKGFENFKWQKKNLITGLFEDVQGANDNLFKPNEPGEFLCILGTERCGEVNTPSFVVLSCTTSTTINLNVCEAYSLIPFLSKSTQSINATKIKMLTLPKNGIVEIIKGVILYTPNNNLSDGTKDTFTYYIEGSGAYPDSEIVTANVIFNKLVVTDAELTSCLINSKANYNLTRAKVTLQTNVMVTYFTNISDAENDEDKIANPDKFQSDLEKVYVRVQSAAGCYKITTIHLNKFPLPDVDVSAYNSELCDLNLDGKYEINFDEVTDTILKNKQGFVVKYFSDSAYTTELPSKWFFSNDVIVYLKILNENNCPPLLKSISFKTKSPLPLSQIAPQRVCDVLHSGSAPVNLQDYATLFQQSSNTNITFYGTEEDAKNKVKSIAPSINITGNKTYFVRIEAPTQCPNVAKLELIFSTPQKSETLQDRIICGDDVAELTVEDDKFDKILWSTGSQETSIKAGIGTYYVDLTSDSCTYRQSVKVTAAELPSIESIEISGSTATIIAFGGMPKYQYSVDDKLFTDRNTFYNLSRGKHTAYLLDSLECKIIEQDFYIIAVTNVITPNGDGINDFLDYSDLQNKNHVQLQIYDRYGKQIFTGDRSNNFKWDGKINGRVLPTDTYWFILEWQEPGQLSLIQFKNWVLLKNRN